ncbi:MAG: TlpA disulfide reductase family protein [Bacteroidetes bacterium]|nr:TlpA disulfide reductase family protein [Bacteroidota bacterium]
MKRILYTTFFLFIGWTAFSQDIVIQGTAPGAEGRIITLSIFSDPITNTEQILTRVKIDSTGNFSLSAPVDKPMVGKLSIEFHDAGLFISPGKIYNINILPYKYNDVKELNPFINSTNLQIELIKLPVDDINYLIGAFDDIYNAFLVEHFNALYRDHNKALLDTLKTKLASTIGEPDDPYVRYYMEYKLANLVQLTQSMNQATIGYRYFTTRPVLYNNVEYMDFFNSYFTKYITVTSRILKKNDYHALLSVQEPYPALMKALAEDSIIKPEQLRELVLLKSLMEMYNSSPDDQKKIIEVLNSIEHQSIIQQNRLIAKNLKQTLTNLQPGTHAPTFQLRNRDNTGSVKLDSLRGKIVVLNFWTSYCTGCTNEMELIKPMVEKFKEKLVFVSVSSEYYWTRMQLFLNMKKDWNWTFLHIGDQIGILKAYDVRSLPLFIIIDKDGNIYKYAAGFPSNGLENSIEQLLQLSK